MAEVAMAATAATTALGKRQTMAAGTRTMGSTLRRRGK
jgi:hypothetical protein